jgi:hypothetical protein
MEVAEQWLAQHYLAPIIASEKMWPAETLEVLKTRVKNVTRILKCGPARNDVNADMLPLLLMLVIAQLLNQ